MDWTLENVIEIDGVLSVKKEINGSLYEKHSIEGSIAIPESISIETYDGDYEITPRLYSQIFDTKGKAMREDVTIYEIPVVATSNPDGGKTVLIG